MDLFGYFSANALISLPLPQPKSNIELGLISSIKQEK
jgi:hypothetical protein